MTCNSRHIWTGDSYAVQGPNDFVLYLGGGRTICDIIGSNLTQVPDHIQLYSGDDPDVPQAIQCSDRDLVIRCSETASIQSVAVSYFDSVARVWRGPYQPENSFTDATKTWFVFRKYLDVVIPFRSEVRVQLAGELNPIVPDDSDNDNTATIIQMIQPPEEFNLALEISIYNNPEMTDLNVALNTVTPNEDFPIRVFNGTGFGVFPVAGVTRKTAGQYVTVDLKNLNYKDKVYIKWTWRGIDTQVVAGLGSGVYPAFTLTNPDNIGFIWETNM